MRFQGVVHFDRFRSMSLWPTRDICGTLWLRRLFEDNLVGGLFEHFHALAGAIVAVDAVTLPPTFIQRERDSGLELIRPPTLDRPKAEFSGFAQGDGLVTPPNFVSMIGTLLPIAPCGRSSL